MDHEEIIDFMTVDDGNVFARLKEKAKDGYKIKVVRRKYFRIKCVKRL